MQKESWQKLFNDFIGGIVNLSIVAIVFFFTSIQAALFFYAEKFFHGIFVGLGAFCLMILLIIGVIAFVDDKATPLLNKSNNRLISSILMIAVGFFLLMPTFYTLFLSNLMGTK